MTRRYHPTPEYVASVGRMIRAAGRRVGAGDAGDLTALAALRSDVEGAIVEAIAGQRSSGVRWVSIGEALGVTKEAAIMRYGAKVRAVTAAGLLVVALAVFALPSPARAAGTAYLTLQAGRALDGRVDQTGAPEPGVYSLAQAVALDAQYGQTTTAVVVVDRENETAPGYATGNDTYSTWTELESLQASYGADAVDAGLHNDLVGQPADTVEADTCDTLPTFAAHGFADAGAEYAYADNAYDQGQARYVDPNTLFAQDAAAGIYQPQTTVGGCFTFGRTYAWPYDGTYTSPAFAAQHGYQTTWSVGGGGCVDRASGCWASAGQSRYAQPSTLIALIDHIPDGDWLDLQFYALLTGANHTGFWQWDCTSANPADHWTAREVGGVLYPDSEGYCANDWATVLAAIPSNVVSATPAQVATAWGVTP